MTLIFNGKLLSVTSTKYNSYYWCNTVPQMINNVTTEVTDSKGKRKDAEKAKYHVDPFKVSNNFRKRAFNNISSRW